MKNECKPKLTGTLFLTGVAITAIQFALYPQNQEATNNSPNAIQTTPQVFRFDGVEVTGKDTNRFMTLFALNPISRYSVDLYVNRLSVPIPASDGRLALPPDERLMKVTSDLKKGDLVDIYLTSNNTLRKIERYGGTEQEDMPDSHLFVRLTNMTVKSVARLTRLTNMTEKSFIRPTNATVNGTEFPAVTLRKFRKESTYPIALMDENGKWHPDQSLAEKLKVFKEGDIVEVDIEAEEPHILRMGMQYFVANVTPYKMPQVGKVVSVHKGSEGKATTVELLIEGKEKPETFDYNSLGTLEAGQEIWCRVTTADGKNYLKFIWWKQD